MTLPDVDVGLCHAAASNILVACSSRSSRCDQDSTQDWPSITCCCSCLTDALLDGSCTRVMLQVRYACTCDILGFNAKVVANTAQAVPGQNGLHIL